jgi:hypothetical protein
MVEGEVPVAKEARHSPRILLGLVPGAPRVGVDGVRGNDAREMMHCQAGPVEKRAVTVGVRQSPRSIRRDANLTHFWVVFASLRTTRLLSVVPLERYQLENETV